MPGRSIGFILSALIATSAVPAVLAFHGGAHGGGHGGFGGGRGGFGGGGARYGGYRSTGGYRSASPAFNRTPSFSMPRSNERFRNEGGGRSAGFANSPRFDRQSGIGRSEMARSQIGPRSGEFERTNLRNNNLNVERGGNRTAIGYQNRYLGYHNNWVHGYWNGNYPGGLGGRGGYGYGGYGYGGGLGYGGLGWGLGTGMGVGLGLGAGYGLSSWLFGPMLYNWGYSSYANPYYGAGASTVIQQPIVYDYSQPINAAAPVPDEGPTTQAMATFDQARAAFQQGDYGGALPLVDQALAAVPNDPSLHEFRALDLFALGRYDESAAALYAVLSVGPGWNWSTMVSLYGDPAAYTNQLRALEAYVAQNRRSAPARFVLAYHYLTEGHPQAAAEQYRDAVALKPSDRLSAQLLQQLQAPPGTATAAAPTATPPADASVQPKPAPAGNLTGTWTAQPAPDTTVTLTFQDAGHFSWKVSRGGQIQQFQGESSYVNGILTMAQDQANAMVGDLVWQDADHFKFTVLGGGSGDPGLVFARTS